MNALAVYFTSIQMLLFYNLHCYIQRHANAIACNCLPVANSMKNIFHLKQLNLKCGYQMEYPKYLATNETAVFHFQFESFQHLTKAE